MGLINQSIDYVRRVMGRRQGPSEERRAAILQAAEQVFVEQGYVGASIREIARRAEVSSALLYWFFPSKAKLFAAVVLARVDSIGAFDVPAQVIDLPPDEFLPRLAHGMTALLAQERQIGLMKLVLRESDREPELVNALSQVVIGRVLGFMHDYFTHQMDLGRMRRAPADFAAQAFAGMFLGLMLRREILQEPESRTWDLAAYVDTALRMFLDGALLPPGSVPEPPLPEP